MSFRSPDSFEHDLDALEDLEHATLRFVSQGVADVLDVAADQFSRIVIGTEDAGDRANYLGEDLTRMALDRIGAPKIPDGRLFGATDYKLAMYQFLPSFAVRQALFRRFEGGKGCTEQRADPGDADVFDRPAATPRGADRGAGQDSARLVV